MHGSLKRFIFGVLFLTMLLGAPSVWAKQPHGFIFNNTYNAGKVVSGATVTHTFELENRGDADFIIEKIITGCGCATTSYDEVIPPGGKGRITVNFNTSGYRGFVERRFTIENNDPERPKMLFIMKTEVVMGVVIDPERVEFIGRPGEEMSREVYIAPNGTPFKIVEHSSRSDKNISYKLKETEVGGHMEYLLTICNLKQNVGRYFDEITLKTDSSVIPVIAIRINGSILPDE